MVLLYCSLLAESFFRKIVLWEIEDVLGRSGVVGLPLPTLPSAAAQLQLLRL